MLTLDKVNKTFGLGTPDARLVLDNLSLNVSDGEFITIIGANGAGKSTLFKAISGRIDIDSGAVMMDGQNITRLPEYRRASFIGQLFQDPLSGTAPAMTIEENLKLASGGRWLTTITAADRQTYRQLLKNLDMGLEDRLTQPVGLLSGGQRQALTLLMATVVPPKLLLLDEHTAALDPAAAVKILNLTSEIVKTGHLTCLMITHDMATALKMGNRTLMMDGGRIVEDLSGPTRQSATVSDLLGMFARKTGRQLSNDRIMLTAAVENDRIKA